MLSALIGTEHSYPALLLAEQLADQRFVHSGPLVTFPSHVTMGADYIFLLQFHNCLGDRHLIEVKKLLSVLHSLRAREQVVTGSNLTMNTILSLSFYVLQRNYVLGFSRYNQLIS